jgi:uncharacterized protein (TIGR02001 family)
MMQRLRWVLSLVAAFSLATTGLAVAEGAEEETEAAAEAEEEEPAAELPGSLSARVAIGSEYVYRGFSRSGEDVALMAGVDWRHDSGFYISLRGANVDFGDSAQLELDTSGGYRGDVEGLRYDVGVMYYWFPGANDSLDYDYIEFQLGLGYDLDFASLSGGFAISPEFVGDTGVGTYTFGGVSIPVPIEDLEKYAVGVEGNLGYQTADDTIGDDNTLDWDVGIVAKVLGFGLDFRYHDTDVSQNRLTDDRFVFTLSRDF